MSSDAALIRRLVGLFRRSKAVRLVGRLAALVAGGLMLLTLVAMSLTLTPAQKADRDLGAFGASITAVDPVPLGQGAADWCQRDIIPEGASTCTFTLSYLLSFDQRTGLEESAVEGQWAENPYPRAFTLISGRWPNAPGEAAVPAHWNTTKLTAVDGAFELAVVGIYIDQFQLNGGSVLLGPGTWQDSTKGVSSERHPRLAASSRYYWLGGDEAAIMQRLAGRGSDPTSRSDFDEVKLPLDRVPLLGIFPLTLIPALTALITVAWAQRWRARTNSTLVSIGVPMRAARWGAVLSTMMSVGLGTGLGCIAGISLAVVVRPALASLSTQPLAPIALPWHAASLVFLCALAGALAGMTTGRTRSTQRGWLIRHGGILRDGVLVLTATGLLVRLPSTSSPEAVALNTLLLVATLALASTHVVTLALRHTPKDLGGQMAFRHMQKQRGRISTAVAGLTALLSLTSCATIAIPTFVAIDNSNVQASLPPGFVALGTLVDSPVPSSTRRDFESYTGLSNPIIVTRYTAQQAGVPGSVMSVASVAELERLIQSSLDEATRQAVESGAALVREPSVLTVTDPRTNQALHIPTATSSFSLALQAGALLLDGWAAHLGPPNPAVQYYYPQVTQDQRTRVVTAASDLRFDPIFVDAGGQPDLVSLTPTHVLVMAVLGLTVAGMVLLLCISQGRELRPILARLRAIGMPQRWIQGVVGRQIVLVLLISMGMTAVAVTVTVASLIVVNDAPPVIPWFQLLVLGSTMLSGAAMGLLAGTRGLTSNERLMELTRSP